MQIRVQSYEVENILSIGLLKNSLEKIRGGVLKDLKILIGNRTKSIFGGWDARGIAVEIPQQALGKLCGENVSGGARNCNGKPGAEVANAVAARAQIFIKFNKKSKVLR